VLNGKRKVSFSLSSQGLLIIAKVRAGLWLHGSLT
jgi:hypothetical protein